MDKGFQLVSFPDERRSDLQGCFGRRLQNPYRPRPGLFESVYELALEHELKKYGLAVERQRHIPVVYDGIELGEGFRADLIVDGKVIVELKSVESLAPVHAKQVLTQLKLTGLKLGLLINFGSLHLKSGIKRLINGTL